MEHNYTESDKIVKAALEQLEVPFNPAHWAAFEQELDAAESLDSDQLFDAAIAGRLSSVDAGNNPADWDFFSQKLEAAEAEEADNIDQVVYSNLNTFEAPYNPTHWALMKEQLEAVFALRVYILRSKIIEAGLMVLALFAILQVFPGDTSLKPIYETTPNRPIAENAIIQSPQETSSDQQAQINNDHGLTADASTNGTTKSAIITAETTSSINPNNQSAARSSEVMVAPVAATDNNTITSTNKFNPLARLPQKSIQLLELPSTSSISPFASGNTVSIPTFAGIEELQSLPLASISELKTVSEASFDIATKPLKTTIKKGLRIGILGSFDYNTIHSPFDEVFKIGPRTTDSIGMSFGLSAAYRLNRWEIDLGALYAIKNYRPLVPVQQYGTFDFLIVEEFEGIHLEELEIPLNLRFNFTPKAPKWQMYGVFGITTSMVLKPIYQIRQSEVLSKEYAAAPPPSKFAKEEEIEERSRLNDKEFPQGLLDGGSFRDNVYFSYNLGLGLERNIDTRWSLFVEPTFINQFRFSPGIGPNEDRFSKFALRFGTKVHVW